MYKIVQNDDPVFYVETAFRVMHVPQKPTPKLKLQLADGGRMYKIWDMMYKIVQNEYKIMIQLFVFELHLGGCSSPTAHPKIWITVSWRRKGVQNLVLGVQNEYKIMIQFYMFKQHWGGCMSSTLLLTPKFELPIAQEGKVYKIWFLMYKIVQNEYKIMIQFFIYGVTKKCFRSKNA